MVSHQCKNDVIRGPEWSNPRVTRTSIKVEDMSPSQRRVIRWTQRAEALKGMSKMLHIPHFSKGEEKPIEEEALYSFEASHEFHQLQQHFQTAGIVTNNRVHYLSPKRTAN